MRPSILRLLTVSAILLLSTLSTACEEGIITTGERGSGNLVNETREAGSFTAVDVGSAIKLDLTVDPAATPSVVVTFDDNIIDMVVTRVSGNTLVLDIDGSVNLTGNAERSITVTINELVALDASGASEVDATGTTGSYQLDASGASRVDVKDLVATDVELDVSGASNVELYAIGTVRGSASGASSLDIYGNPASVLVDSSGASSVDIKN
jgi:hypothetical protein